MLEIISLILFVLCMAFVWWAYHQVFEVIYFDLGKGCVQEIIITIFLGGMLYAILMKFWYIALIIVGIIVFIKVKK